MSRPCLPSLASEQSARSLSRKIVYGKRGAGEEFGSPSSFSMHVKRFQTPGKQGDDGWKSVTYEGQPLEQLRRQLTAGPAATKKVLLCTEFAMMHHP